MKINKPHVHDYIQKVDSHDQLRWHECKECKQWEECNCTQEEFEANLHLPIRFSEELFNDAVAYLEIKTGSKPSDDLTNDFLQTTARLGRLFLKYAHEITKQD